MGRGGSRPGSGRPGWKAKAEQSLPLDVRVMYRRGCLKLGFMGGGSWRWTWTGTGEDAGSISYWFDDHNLQLRFRANGESRTQDVPVVRTPCHFGKSRPWFRCPLCSRRVAVLYHRGGRFACRHCQRVAYLSQSEDVIGRAWRRQGKVERQLVEGFGRPKGMHTATYERLLAVIEECEEVKDASLFAFLRRHGLAL